jgi:membrane associated rhomboid family serine protease
VGTPVPDRPPPWVTYLLVTANVVVFVVPPTTGLTVFRNGGWLLLLGNIVFQWFAGYLGQASLGFLVGLLATAPMLRRRPRHSYPSRRHRPRATAG